MAFDRILRPLLNRARLMAVVPALALATATVAAPAPAQAASVGVQTCTVVLFVEVCTGGDVGTGSGGASPAPAPMMGGSILSLAILGGFVAYYRRNAKARNAGLVDQPTLGD